MGPCPTCICGPTSPSFSECPWPPLPDTTIGTTMMPSTTLGTTKGTTVPTTSTTTPAITTTAMPPSTTTTMPATSPTRPPCEVAEGEICDEGEHNLIEHIEHISSASDCQAICQNHPGSTTKRLFSGFSNSLPSRVWVLVPLQAGRGSRPLGALLHLHRLQRTDLTRVLWSRGP